MTHHESDEEFMARLTALAQEDHTEHLEAIRAGHAAAWTTFQERLREQRIAERRAVSASRRERAWPPRALKTAPKSVLLRIGVPATAVIALVGVAGIQVYDHFSTESQGTRLASPSQPAAAETIQTTLPTGEIVSGQYIDKTGAGHPSPLATTSVKPADPNLTSAVPPPSWLVKADIAVAVHRFALKASIRSGSLTAVVSAEGSLPCSWGVTVNGVQHQEKPRTSEPTPVDFPITQPTDSIVLSANRPSGRPDGEAGDCLMANIQVKGYPITHQAAERSHPVRMPTPGPSHSPSPSARPTPDSGRPPHQEPEQGQESNGGHPEPSPA